LSAQARDYRYRPYPNARSLRAAVIACLRQRLAERHRAKLPTIDRTHRAVLTNRTGDPILAPAADTCTMLHEYHTETRL